MFVAGIDAGTRSTKVVLTGPESFSWVVLDNGAQPANTVVEKALQQALQEAGISRNDIGYVIATGQGSEFVTLSSHKETDSACLAKGTECLFPSSTVVVDIGARKSLVVRFCKGKVVGTRRNDKCAAGAGLYLEKIADILNLPFTEIGDLSLKSTERLEIVSTCGAFIESEVISLIHSRKKAEDVLMGVFRGTAERIVPLIVPPKPEKDVVLVGGVARNKGIIRALKQALACEILVPENPEIVAALGAALLAKARGRDVVRNG